MEELLVRSLLMLQATLYPRVKHTGYGLANMLKLHVTLWHAIAIVLRTKISQTTPWAISGGWYGLAVTLDI